jgi:hypothetical protein
MIEGQGQFAGVAGQNITASLTYGGVPHALLFSENAAQTSATISIPATGFSQTFNAADASDLQTQIKNFIKQNGAGAYAEFIKSINQTSMAATVDGNPLSFTAFVSDIAFNHFGLNSTLSQAPMNGSNDGQDRVDLAGGYQRTEGLDGGYAQLALESDWRFTSNVALSFNLGLQYRDMGGSESDFATGVVGLPITILNQNGGLAWQVTPWVFAGAGASVDQVAGAVLLGGGGTSELSLQLADFTFSLADQINYGGGVPVAFDDDTFDTDVDQWILKNGVKVFFAPGQGPFFAEAGISYSTILNPAAVRDYWTPEVGVGFLFNPSSGIKFDYSGDFAKGYSQNGGMLSLFLSY